MRQEDSQFDEYRGKWVAFDYATGQILVSAESHDELLVEIREKQIANSVITRIAAIDETTWYKGF